MYVHEFSMYWIKTFKKYFKSFSKFMYWIKTLKTHITKYSLYSWILKLNNIQKKKFKNQIFFHYIEYSLFKKKKFLFFVKQKLFYSYEPTLQVHWWRSRIDPGSSLFILHHKINKQYLWTPRGGSLMYMLLLPSLISHLFLLSRLPFFYFCRN